MVISTESLCKKYGEKIAVKDMTITVGEGEVYGFLGPNGAGKSTFIKMLTGLVHPTSGKGQVLGLPFGDEKARMRLGYLPELFRFQDWMTGSDLLDFHSNLFKLKSDPERNRRVLERTGMLGREKQRVGTYSKGMQQRIGLAAALLPDPQLLLLDEPTSALDPVGRKEVRDIIISLKAEGRTVLLNSHLLSEVEAVSDRVTIINQGSVVKSGAVAELLAEKHQVTIDANNVGDCIGPIKERFNCDAELLPTGIRISIDNRDNIPAIISMLVERGAQIYQVKTQSETLEDIFLKSIGEEAAE